MVKKKLGHEKNPFKTTKEEMEEFTDWNKKKAEINGALNILAEAYKKKRDLGQKTIAFDPRTTQDSGINYSEKEE